MCYIRTLYTMIQLLSILQNTPTCAEQAVWAYKINKFSIPVYILVMVATEQA